MGNSTSVPEKVFLAVQRNDVCAFQALLGNLGAAAANNQAARKAVLEYKDKSGRTPLLVAASKNHYQILQQLIQLGADVHYINPARDSLGGALHEAAAKRHEAAVELLLGAGACPFAANAAGRTALDEAVLSGHTGVVRTIEKYAEFAGPVAFKSRTLGGFSCKYKTRWAVLMPFFPFHRDRDGAAALAIASAGGLRSSLALDPRKPRRCLWLYKDRASVSPRCRLWVDGATLTTSGPAGTEGTLKLHTAHGEPVGDLATSYAGGYCVCLRPADLTAAAATAYHRLVALIGAGTATATGINPPQRQPGVAVPGSTNAPGTPPPPPAPHPGAMPPMPFYPVVPPAAAAVAYTPAAYVLLNPQPPPQGGVGTPPPAGSVLPPAAAYRSQSAVAVYPGAAGPCLMASPLSLAAQQQQRQGQGQAGVSGSGGGSDTLASVGSAPLPGSARLGMEPVLAAGAGSGAAQQQRDRVSSPPALTREAAVGSGGQVIGETFIEHMAALPGESDEAFAARLASAISATSGHSQQTLFPQPQPHAALRTAEYPPAAAAAAAAAETPSTPATAAATSGVAAGLGPLPAALAGSLGAAAVPTNPRPTWTSSSAGGIGTNTTSGAGLINFHSDPGNGAAAAGSVLISTSQSGNQLLTSAVVVEQQQPDPAGGRRPSPSPLDELDIEAVNALIAAEAEARGQTGASATAAAAPSTSRGEKAAAAAPPPPRYAADVAEDDAEPSAPLAEPFLTTVTSPGRPATSYSQKSTQAPPPPRPPPPPAESDADCIICLSAPREVGFLHGDSVHRCVCRECSGRIARGAPCPLCRQPVERVLGVY